MAHELNLNIIPVEGSVVIREGKALELKEPQKITINGILDSPLRWLMIRESTIDQLKCNILVDRDKMNICLQINEKDHYRDHIIGVLSLHPDFIKFGINSGNYITNFDMAELFRMNRASFENRSQAMKLTTELQNFKAKVNKEVENADNNRGDRKLLLNQVVTSNLPEKFKLCIPIFKGTSKCSIEVEVFIKADDLTCTLVSPAANEMIEDTKNDMMDKVLNEIKEKFPQIVIIEY